MTRKIIAHITDTHLGQKLVSESRIDGDRMHYQDAPDAHRDRLRLVLDDIARRGITNIVFGGDIGTAESVGGFFELLRSYDFTPSIVLGNHDSRHTVAPHCSAGATPVAGKMCSSFEDGGVKHLLLDSSDNTIGDGQLGWLAGELVGARRVLLFLHHPVLDIDSPIDRSGAALRDRSEIKALLARAGCDVTIFCGHYHMADEAHEANIRQFITPAVSYQIVRHADRVRTDARSFGYRVLEIEGTGIGSEAILFRQA
jgi:Icc protein